jgi:tetratricopeptide (TPR) repeat protein
MTQSSTFSQKKALNEINTLFSKGVSFDKEQKYEEALTCYDKILSMSFSSKDILRNKAFILFKLERYDDSLNCFEQILSSDPSDINALSNKITLLIKFKKYKEALSCCKKASSIDPSNQLLLATQAYILSELNEYEKALSYYNKLTAITPNDTELLNAKGLVFTNLFQYENALKTFNQALSLDPKTPEASFNKSLILLLKGKVEEGFKLYEQRWNTRLNPSKKINLTQPLWIENQDSSNKTLLIYPEQGFGDSIQMFRYINKLEKTNNKVILMVYKPLKELFSSNVKNTHIICKDDPIPDFDYQCPTMSLPLSFNTSLDNIFSPISYIKASPKKVNHWKDLLPKKTKPFIGIIWSGKSSYKHDKNRSIPFSKITSLFRDDLQFISLQKDISEHDSNIIKSNDNILHFGDQLKDFSDTAALTEHMDLIITVDTSVAHLSGAMGKPTWILTRFSPDWRWLLDRDDSPWYKSVKLFRQNSPNAWDDVLLKIKNELSLIV